MAEMAELPGGATATPAAAGGAAAIGLEPACPPLSILIVDDDPDICRTLGDVLENQGYVTTPALTGREALLACEGEDFGLVILDVNLPDIQGERLLPQLVALLPEVEVLVITGQATLESAIQSVSPNTVGYFLKPFTMDRLLETVARIAARKRMARENALMQLRLQRGKEELEESRRALEALLGNLPGMAYRCRFEPARPMEFVSEGCFDLTERHPQELLAGNCGYSELVHPDDRRWIWDEIESSVARRRPFQLIYRIVCPSGATRWVWEQGRATVKRAGANATLDGFIADITERHGMQEQARHQEKMAALGLLAAGVAHEVGNPLASISGVTQTLLRRTDDPKVIEKLELIKAHVQRISHIVREMQSFGRPPVLDWKPCALNEVLARAVDMIRFDKRAANVDIHLEMARDLPTSYAIEDQLLQVFLNVLLNALDALSSTGESRSRRLSIVSRRAAPQHEPALVVEFDDAGIGIPKEAVGRVFDPFFTTKEVGYGTGLGLAVCYRIVEEHRGHIGIDSEPTRGTRVRITLPVLERPPDGS
ncbi:MAG: ATP-binding protein [Acidobacteriota bacterium]|nr:ATP-binding protein [Acidobacteriota bacterium]MDH3525559.1 ATP-binding protein [Acidobacteriota bacterium]